MSLRFLSSPKIDFSKELEKEQYILDIKKLAPKARELTAIDLGDDVDEVFKVLENLSLTTSFRTYKNAATKFLIGDFQYGSTLFIPKLESDTHRALFLPAMITDITVGSAYYFATYDILRTLLLSGIVIPLGFCIGYGIFQNSLKAGYAKRYYTPETWKPVGDLKKQLDYFNTNFVAPENTSIDKLTLSDLVYLPNTENQMKLKT